MIVFPCEKPEGNDTPRQNVLENGSLAANPEFLSLPLFKYLVFGTGSSYATRFNRFRQERGHLFQGRYQAILVEDFSAMGRVVDYIHRNPVRAAIVPVEQVAAFRWSSLRRFVKGPRFPGLVAAEWRKRPPLDLLSLPRQAV